MSWGKSSSSVSMVRKKIDFILFKINKPVAFCDGWHLLKSIFIWSISLAFGLMFEHYDILVVTLIVRTLFGFGFHVTYR